MLFSRFRPQKEDKKEEEELLYFSDFVAVLVEEMKMNDRERTARAYQTVCNVFLSFNEKKDLRLKEIDSQLIKRYEAYLRRNDKRPNTISFYMRNLRAILNKAKKAKLIPRDQDCSFEDVYTGIDKTIKRAIKKDVIHKLSRLDLSGKKNLELSQHLFMFSFYTRGMSFIDMAFLRKIDLNDGIIRYRRHKTGQWLEIKITSEISGIINCYKEATRCSEYLLPIISGSSSSVRVEYENALKTHNNRLYHISKMLNLKIRLTSYVARHSWATIAKELNIPLSVISEGLGHNSEKTTQIYLASFDHTVLHRANAKVIA